MNVISEQKMRAECYYRRKKNIYDADKEKVHRDQTLGNTGGNNNKDMMFDRRIEVAVRVKTNVIVIFI